MEFVPNTHSDTYHVDMTMQDCIDRILTEQTTAASAFLDTNTRDVLTKETIRLCESTIDEFLCDYNGDNRITITHAFTESEAQQLGVPTTHLGVILDKETNRIWLMTTNLVSVILLRDHTAPKGYRIDNSYPNVASTKYGQKLNINPLPYVMSSETWTSLNMMERVMWRIRCNHASTYTLTYANITKGLILDINECGESLGTVTITPTSTIWNVTNDTKALSMKNNSHMTIMSRAFPETTNNVRDVYSKIQDDKFDTSLNAPKTSISDVMDIRLLIRAPQIPDTSTPEPVKEKRYISDNKKKKTRGRKHALSRSRNAAKKAVAKKPKKHTVKAINSDETPTIDAQPFQFKHVPTTYETDGMTQTQINMSVSEMMIHNYIPFANVETGETLLFWNELNRRRLVLAILPKNKLSDIADAISEANPNLDKETLNHPVKVLEIAQQSAHELYELSTYDERRVLSYIAHETKWQPILNQREKDWIDTHCTDSQNRPLSRKPNRSNKTTIKELLGKDISESTKRISTLSSILNLQPMSQNDIPKDKLKQLDKVYESLHRYQPRSIKDLM